MPVKPRGFSAASARKEKDRNVEFFWKQQDDIPDGMGYPLFGTEHIVSTAVTLWLVVAFLVVFRKMNEKRQRLVLKAIPLSMVGLEAFKDLFLVHVHRFSLGYLPLHVCSVGIFVFLLREFLPWKKAKAVFGEIAFILIMPGSLAALIFPDWTVYYPVLNFINLHSFLWHGLLVLYPLMVFFKDEVSPSVKHIHYVLLFLLAVVPPVYAFDKHFGYNYFFVNWPLSGTPLEWIASVMGNPGYLVGYAGLAIAVMLLLYLLVHVLTKAFSGHGIA